MDIEYEELFLELPPPEPPKPAETEVKVQKPEFDVDYNVRLYEINI